MFFIDTSPRPARPATFDVGTAGRSAPYDPEAHRPRAQLGGVDEWTLQSHFVSHPFHIHVNPFQIVKILDPDGKDVSAAGRASTTPAAPPDPQYPGSEGRVEGHAVGEEPRSATAPRRPGIYTIVVRTRYERYIGDFVLHCHILDHEDQGMMQNVAIRVPDGAGGTTSGHH